MANIQNMNSIKLFVGLGNPGTEYVDTRHNAGFWWLDRLAAISGSKFANESRFFGHVGKLKSTHEDGDPWLLKPSTFMNASGRSVAALAQFYKIDPENILVIHDELDIPPGQVKLKKGGGHGGHNGLKDIAAHLGTNDFWRMRLGIGHPGDRNEVISFVLHAPSKNEMQLIEQTIDDSVPLTNLLLRGNFEAAMLKLHTKSKVL
jgi:PTH1 family peptidyl-tRNA hydrolase